ncbi:hypothetical protein Ancab_039271 [Ancistrocladus abbreviatus]
MQCRTITGFQSARVVAVDQSKIPLRPNYPEEFNNSQEGLDDSLNRDLELIADEPLQKHVDAGEHSQNRSDSDTPLEAIDETSNEIDDPPVTVISKRCEKKKKNLEDILNLRLSKKTIAYAMKNGGHITHKGKKSGRSSDGKMISYSEESINDSQIINRNRILRANDNPADIMGPNLSSRQIWDFLTKIGIDGTMDQESVILRIDKMEKKDATLFTEELQKKTKESAKEAVKSP